MSATVYTYSSPGHFTPNANYAAVASNPSTGLAALGYTARPDVDTASILTVYVGSQNMPYQFAAVVTLSNRTYAIFFNDINAISSFLTAYAPLLPVLDFVLVL